MKGIANGDVSFLIMDDAEFKEFQMADNDDYDFSETMRFGAKPDYTVRCSDGTTQRSKKTAKG